MRLDFTSFYEAQAPRLVRTVTVSVGDPALAEEVVAEAFARAWARWPQVRACEQPAAWVMRVALNHSRDRLRRRAIERRNARVVAQAEVVDDPHPRTDRRLWEAVRSLPRRERTLVALRYVADLTQNEIAQVLGIPAGTVASGLHRARRSLASAGPDVSIEGGPSTAAFPGSRLPGWQAPPEDCLPRNPEAWNVWAPGTIPAAEVPDEMRVIPTWTPDGEPVTSAVGNRWTNPWCPEPGQARTEGRETTTWSVGVGDYLSGVARGTVCLLQVDRPREAAAFDMSTYGGEVVTVNGQDAAWFTSAGPTAQVLAWEVAPGVRARANCSFWDASGGQDLDVDTVRRLAESVVPVSPDDPRIPDQTTAHLGCCVGLNG